MELNNGECTGIQVLLRSAQYFGAVTVNKGFWSSMFTFYSRAYGEQDELEAE